jgi:hypothetical protein
MADEKSYEIFRKELDNTTVRVECVKGLEEAQRSLKKAERDAPGEYYIFDPLAAKVIDVSEPSVAKDPFAP